MLLPADPLYLSVSGCREPLAVFLPIHVGSLILATILSQSVRIRLMCRPLIFLLVSAPLADPNHYSCFNIIRILSSSPPVPLPFRIRCNVLYTISIWFWPVFYPLKQPSFRGSHFFLNQFTVMRVISSTIMEPSPGGRGYSVLREPLHAVIATGT